MRSCQQDGKIFCKCASVQSRRNSPPRCIWKRWPIRTPLRDSSVLCVRSRLELRRTANSQFFHSVSSATTFKAAENLSLPPVCYVLSSCAMAEDFNNPTPQFGTAEYVGAPG